MQFCGIFAHEKKLLSEEKKNRPSYKITGVKLKMTSQIATNGSNNYANECSKVHRNRPHRLISMDLHCVTIYGHSHMREKKKSEMNEFSDRIKRN